MTKDITYKVLWVDDDESIVDGTILDAEEYNLQLDHYTNWQDAEQALKKNFNDYSAIILDANCKIRRDSLEEEDFITAVLPSLLRIFGEKRQYIPWYLLSAGTMSNFDFIVKGAMYQHAKHEEEWGNMLYMKDAPDDSEECSSKLFENIQKVAKNMVYNTILYRHSDIFAYTGDGRLIDGRARKLLLRMFAALYAPEENIKFEFAGNPLRKVIEYVFRAARKIGLLTNDCFDSNDHIVLLDASRYMSGRNIKCYDGRNVKYYARWGEEGIGKEGSGGDSIFPSDVAMMVKNTLNFSSTDSHTEEDEPFFIDEENKELFFSYMMQVAHLVKWFGKYAEQHSDVEKNKSMQQIIKIPPKVGLQNKGDGSLKVPTKPLDKASVIGKSYLIQPIDGIPACGNHKLSDELRNRKGLVTILELQDNLGDDRDKFPYIVTKVK